MPSTACILPFFFPHDGGKTSSGHMAFLGRCDGLIHLMHRKDIPEWSSPKASRVRTLTFGVHTKGGLQGWSFRDVILSLEQQAVDHLRTLQQDIIPQGSARGDFLCIRVIVIVVVIEILAGPYLIER